MLDSIFKNQLNITFHFGKVKDNFMSSKSVFKSVSTSLPTTDAVNLAGGKAYSLSAKQAAAQYAVTGTFNGTFYASGNDQLKQIKDLLSKVDPTFIAKLAIYSRESAYMKDMPAFLLASLSVVDVKLFKQVFPRVADNAKIVRNFVQIIRSGVVGRKSLGSAPKKAIKAWIDARTDEQLFNDSVGNDPSLIDILKLVHAKSSTPSRDALYKYLLKFEGAASNEHLPAVVKQLESFKLDPSNLEAPKVSFQMLTALPLTTKHWTKIAQDAAWQMTRMNLNTFERHGVFADLSLIDTVALRLKNEKFISTAKVFPYQLFAAFKSVSATMPVKIKLALQDAMESSVKNVPAFENKKVFVGVDISGSMTGAITGARGSATSNIVCNEVAALLAASILKSNENNCEVYQFDTECKPMKQLNPRDSIMTNIQKIAFNGGGTDCSAVLRHLNEVKAKGDLVIIISDNMSWVDMTGYNTVSTNMTTAWKSYKARNKGAKLVCLDLVPQTHVQVVPSSDVLYVGGFSDSVFDVIREFANSDENNSDYFVNKIETSITL